MVNVCLPTVHLDEELKEGRVADDRQITREDDRRVLKRALAKLVDWREYT